MRDATTARTPRLRVWAAILVTLMAAPAAVAQEAARTYTNPIHARDFPDPFVLRQGDTFYAYATETRGTGIQLMESRDLVHWTPRRLEFPIPWAREHYWAPEVVAHGGRFYLTYSALDPATRKHHVAVATSDAPTGPFVHRAFLVRGDDNRIGVIDATIHFEAGAPYLIYSEEDPRRIVVRPLRDDLLAVAGEPVELIRPDRDWERGVTEAPTLVRRNGLYHLFYSFGPFQGTKAAGRYGIGHAVARSLTGPYEKSAPLMESVEGEVYGPGHQCVVALEDGSWWMLYHAWNDAGEPRYGRNPLGRTLRIDRLEWDGDTPRIHGPTITPRPAPFTATVDRVGSETGDGAAK
jgi:beta-xylosidase